MDFQRNRLILIPLQHAHRLRHQPILTKFNQTMLKNELEILTAAFSAKNGVGARVHKGKLSDFSEVVSEGCDRAMRAWAIAAFSDHPNDSIGRYFDYHFNFLNGLIAEYAEETLQDPLKELLKLMDHLLLYYGKFLDRQQLVTTKYLVYRCHLQSVKYKLFIDQVLKLNGDEDLIACFSESLSSIYLNPPVEPSKLNAFFYREELLIELAGRRHNNELMTTNCLISVLISFNFNHTRFFAYLRKRSIKGISTLSHNSYSSYLRELSAEIPKVDITNDKGYDSNWPHIAAMYQDWLSDYEALLAIALRNDNQGNAVNKIPLSISVKQLACLIRALYESGFYGNISLKAIFDHAANVFTTKRQEQISSESISNAYYALPQSSVLKVTHLLSKAVDFLKPYCFPVEAVKGAAAFPATKIQSVHQTRRN